MKKFRVTIGAKSYEVEVGDLQESPLTVIVDGEAFSVDMQPVGEAQTSQAPTGQVPAPGNMTVATASAGPSRVTAPMPGTILDIAVQPGDQVQQAQVLCALEAMKMKSPIRSLRGGTVRQVQVQEGQTVEHGDLLFVIE